MITIAVVDDHPLTRRGVESILGENPDFRIVASVDGPDGLPPVEGIDVVVLDLYLGTDEPSIDVIDRLAPHTRVLVVSASGKPADVLGCVRVGASGYLTKSASAEMFASAVRTVATGGFALSAQLADILSSELARERRMRGGRPAAAPAAKQELSPREEEVLRYIARGYTHAQTATRMKLSKATVDTYVERIRGKLQVGNKAELTRVAIEMEQRRAGPGHPGEEPAPEMDVDAAHRPQTGTG